MKYAHRIQWLLLALFIAGCASTGAHKMEPMDPNASGYVTIEDDEVMLIIGGSDGHGTLKYQGAEYRFKIRGVKVGGIGFEKLAFSGNVYNLKKLEDFDGAYFSAEAAASFVKGEGGIWMRNARRVSIHLSGSSGGAALGMGLEGVDIRLVK